MSVGWHPSLPGHRIIVTGISGIEMKEGAVRWAHEATYTLTKGKTKILCACGWQGTKTEDMRAAREEYDKHVGLAVKIPK